MTARRPPSGIFVITKPDQFAAMASPARQEILDVITAISTASVADLAAILGRSPHSLYHHVRVLQRAGLILRWDMRNSGRREEVVYAAPGRRVQLRYDLGSPTFIRDMRRSASATLRLTERDFHRGLASPTGVRVIPRVNLWAGRMKGRLTRDQLREVHRLMWRIYTTLGDHPEQTQGALHAITMFIAPIPDGHASNRRRATGVKQIRRTKHVTRNLG